MAREVDSIYASKRNRDGRDGGSGVGGVRSLQGRRTAKKKSLLFQFKGI